MASRPVVQQQIRGGKQVSRPLTRDFCAQLLANAQAAAADKNKKCIGAVNVDGVAAANRALTLKMEKWSTINQPQQKGSS
nr:G2/mitotic-specific cyclin-1 [Ipomoea trifida]